MYYVYKNDVGVLFVSENKPSKYADMFVIDELPYYPNVDNATITLKADFENHKVWYEVNELPNKSVDLDTINENVLAIMEGLAASYEEQSSNDMNIMEGLAAIYEEQIGGTQ